MRSYLSFVLLGLEVLGLDKILRIAEGKQVGRYGFASTPAFGRAEGRKGSSCAAPRPWAKAQGYQPCP
jgi:hypothetical protein